MRRLKKKKTVKSGFKKKTIVFPRHNKKSSGGGCRQRNAGVETVLSPTMQKRKELRDKRRARHRELNAGTLAEAGPGDPQS